MQVEVPAQVLTPGMKHGAHAQLTIQPLGIAARRSQCGPHCLKKQPLDHVRMQRYPSIQVVRQGKHDVEVAHRQQVLVLPFSPAPGRPTLALWAMTITATVVPQVLVATAITLGLDRAHGRCAAST